MNIARTLCSTAASAAAIGASAATIIVIRNDRRRNCHRIAAPSPATINVHSVVSARIVNMSLFIRHLRRTGSPSAAP